MSVTINYILEQEKLKKQQEQETVPGIEPQQQENFEEEFPNVNRVVAPQNKSALPPFSRGVAEVMNERARQPQQQIEPQAQIEQPQQPISMKPEHWSDDEYNAVKQLYSDEQIQSMFSNPDPNELLNGIISNIYKANTPEPKLPDEKQMAKQRKYAAIGDALSLFSQAAGASQGAYVRERKFEEGAMGRLSENQQKLYDRYLQRADRYSRGLVNAQIQDYLRGEQDWRTTQQGIGKVLEQHRKEKITQAKADQDAAYKREQLQVLKDRQKTYDKNIDAQIEDRKVRTGITKRNADIQAARAEAYIEKLKESPKGKPEYQIVIPANPNDPDAEQDQFGNAVRAFDMTNADKERYARDAINDESFMNRHPELQPNFGKALTNTQRDDIAAAYVQEQYNNSFRVDAGGVDAGVYAGKLGSQVKPPTKDSFAQVASDKEFLKYVKQRNPDLHAAMKSGEIKRKDEQDYIIQIHKEWLENNKQDPVEQSMQKVQELDAEYDLDDEFAIVGTL